MFAEQIIFKLGAILQIVGALSSSVDCVSLLRLEKKNKVMKREWPI